MPKQDWYNLWVRDTSEPQRWWTQDGGSLQYCRETEEKLTGYRPKGRYPDTLLESLILHESESPYEIE